MNWRMIIEKIKKWLLRKGVQFACETIDEFREDIKEFVVEKCKSMGECHTEYHQELVRTVVDVVLDEIKEELQKRVIS